MLILLPPSEGKTPALSGPPVDLASLVFPELAPAREKALGVLAKVSARKNALTVLGVGASLAPDVARNVGLLTAAGTGEPAAPAARVYSGVLFDALGMATLPAAARRKAEESILVFSGLWGVVRLTDRIPAYRLSMGATLPGVGKLSAWWKPRLTPLLDDLSAEELVIDCRSSTYAAAWKPPSARTVVVRVFRETDGVRSVVSHMAKETRGHLARHLVTRPGRRPASPQALLKAARERWPETEFTPARGPAAAYLDIVLS